MICPEWAHEWSQAEALLAVEAVTVKDANGTLLHQGDKVILAKDLKVKGGSLILKMGTKAMTKLFVDGKDHQLDCKVDGAGGVMVTAKLVKRA